MDLMAGQITAGHWAEIEEVWARDGLIRLSGSLRGPQPAAGRWRLRLVPVERGAPASPRSWLSLRVRRLRTARRPAPGPYDVTVSAGRFDAAVPVRDLVPPRPLRSETWNVHLVCDTPGHEECLRAGRHLGLPSRARAITYPAQTAGGRFRVRPFYTADNHLAIGSRRAP
jgi:hypothetical protein